MVKSKVKAEIQALSSFGFQYLSQQYLPQKLKVRGASIASDALLRTLRYFLQSVRPIAIARCLFVQEGDWI